MVRPTLELPLPECVHGYTPEQIRQIMGNDLELFDTWIAGGDLAGCGQHGPVVRVADVVFFLRGLTRSP